MQYELSGVQKGIAAAVLTLASIRTNKSTTEITESMLKLVAKRKMEELEDRTSYDKVSQCAFPMTPSVNHSLDMARSGLTVAIYSRKQRSAASS